MKASSSKKYCCGNLTKSPYYITILFKLSESKTVNLKFLYLIYFQFLDLRLGLVWYHMS